VQTGVRSSQTRVRVSHAGVRRHEIGERDCSIAVRVCLGRVRRHVIGERVRSIGAGVHLTRGRTEVIGERDQQPRVRTPNSAEIGRNEVHTVLLLLPCHSGGATRDAVA
jgi:hypothetical protein